MTKEIILEKLSKKLGDEDFILPSKLVEAGIFGSSTACRNALQKGVIPSLKITKNRILIPRQAVLDHINRCYQG